MLCDDIAAVDRSSLRRLVGRTEAEIRLKTYGWWTEAIRNSQRFVLDDDLTASLASVAEGRPSSILTALEYMRLPFDLCWFEWPETPRRRFAKIMPEAISPDAEVQYRLPDRIGMLCQRGDNDEIFVEMAWSGAAEAAGTRGGRLPQTSPLSIEWSTNPGGFDLPIDQMRDFRPGLPEIEYSAMHKLGRMVHLHISNYHLLAVPEARREEWFEYLKRNADQFTFDWQAEYRFLAAMLIMLNTKNGVQNEASDLREQNRRRKITRKLPLLEHRIVHLRRSVRERHDEPNGDSRAAPRAHLVRGHFKVRSSGVFWWSPFVRGDAQRGIVTHEYQVHC